MPSGDAIRIGLCTVVTSTLVAGLSVGARADDSADPFFTGDWMPISLEAPQRNRTAYVAAIDSQGRVILGSQGRDPSTSWSCEANISSERPEFPETQTAYVAYLERYSPNGKLDTTFGVNGVVTIPQLAHSQALRTMEVLPDGSTIVIMEGASWGCLPHKHIQRDIALRITSSGAWDREWTPGGARVTDEWGNFALTVNGDDAVLGGDGKLQVISNGIWEEAALPPRSFPQSLNFGEDWLAMDGVSPRVWDDIPRASGIRVSLLPSDGVLGNASRPITTFIPLDLPEHQVASMRHLFAWDAQGRLIVVSTIYIKSTPMDSGSSDPFQDSYLLVHRLLVAPDGSLSLDPDFATLGTYTFQPEPIGRPAAWTHAYQVGTDSRGRVVVLGLAPLPDHAYTNMALRLTSEGQLDPAFGNDGTIPLPIEAVMEGPAALDFHGRWFMAADAEIIPAGKSRAQPRGTAVLRISPSGGLSASVGLGWRRVKLAPKRPVRLSLERVQGCSSGGSRTFEAAVRVTTKTRKGWAPVPGLRVDLTVSEGNGNTTVLMRKSTNKQGRVLLRGRIVGTRMVGIYTGISDSYLPTYIEKTCR